MNSQDKHKLSRERILGNLLISLIIMGYPLSAAISQLSGADSNYINVIFRSFVVLISFALLIYSTTSGQYRLNYLIILFLLLYTSRMISDFKYSSFPRIGQDFAFYLATVLAPTLSLGAGRVWFDERLCLRFMVGLGGFSSLLIAYLMIFQPDNSLLEVMGNRAGFNFLNPIAVSYHGLYTAAAAFMLIAMPAKGRSRAWLVVIGLLGGYLFFAGGSRGPAVALLLAVLITGLANEKTAKYYAVLGILLIVLIAAIGAPDLILQRFQTAGYDASSQERFIAVQLSIEAALRHPLLGFGYIEPITNSYPHNLVIEAALALGIGGAILMVWLQLSLLSGTWILARRGEWLLPFLGATVFANAWISSAIWSGPFFGLLWLIRGRAVETSAKLTPTTWSARS